MSQLVSDLDFGIGSKARRWIAAVIVVVLFNFQHDEVLLPRTGLPGPLPDSEHIACQQQEFLLNQISPPCRETEALRAKPVSVNIRNSAAGDGVRYYAWPVIAASGGCVGPP